LLGFSSILEKIFPMGCFFGTATAPPRNI